MHEESPIPERFCPIIEAPSMHVSTDTVFCNQLALDVEIGFHAVEQDVLQTVLVDLELS